MKRSNDRGLDGLRFGDHICLSYDHPDEARGPLVPYFREGLLRGERCVFIGSAAENDTLVSDLTAAGVDARRALDGQRLILQTPETIYPSGAFSASDMLELIDRLVEDAVANGHAGLRGAGEMVPTPPPALWPELRDYEAQLNDRCAVLPIIALCRYDHARCPPAILRDSLRTHPTVLVRGRLCDNPFYEPPAVAVRPDDDTARVAWMMRQLRFSQRTRQHLHQLTASLAAETAQLAAENVERARAETTLRKGIEIRDRFLAMLADELWVPMGPLLSQLKALVGEGAAGRRNPKRAFALDAVPPLEAMIQQVAHLARVVEQARDISRLTNRQAIAKVEEFDLADAIRQVTLHRREQLLDAGCSISLRTAGRIQGRWDRERVEQVAGNLLVNAMTRGRGKAVDLDLTSDEETASLSVRDRGAAISAADQALLFDRLEGAFGPTGERRHPPRQGLWVTREIVTALGGSIDVVNQPDGAVTFLVELPRSRPGRRGALS